MLHMKLTTLPSKDVWENNMSNLDMLAATIAKYDLSAATSSVVHPWLKRFRGRSHRSGYEDLAAIAFRVNDSAAFEDATKGLSMTSAEDIVALKDRPAYTTFPNTIFSKIPPYAHTNRRNCLNFEQPLFWTYRADSFASSTYRLQRRQCRAIFVAPLNAQGISVHTIWSRTGFWSKILSDIKSFLVRMEIVPLQTSWMLWIKLQRKTYTSLIDGLLVHPSTRPVQRHKNRHTLSQCA